MRFLPFFILSSLIVNSAEEMGHTYENSFILCHDIKDFTIATMDRFITDALKEGYTFLPITSESRTCHHGINN